jgi:hypothetical protein
VVRGKGSCLPPISLEAENLDLVQMMAMKTGDSLEILTQVRSQKTGVLLPRRGTFISDIENLGRRLILVDFGAAGEAYLFPHEVAIEKWVPDASAGS